MLKIDFDTKDDIKMESAVIRFGVYCKSLGIDPDQILDHYNEQGLTDEQAIVLATISMRYSTGMVF